MRTRQALRKKSSDHKSNAPAPDFLESRPFAVQAKVEEQEGSPEPKRYESTLADFAILNPEGGRSMPVQPKLAIGQPGAQSKQETARVVQQMGQQTNLPQSLQPDVSLRQGAYEARNQGGQESLAHDLTYVAQQGRNSPQIQRVQVLEPKDYKKKKGEKQEVEGVKKGDVRADEVTNYNKLRQGEEIKQIIGSIDKGICAGLVTVIAMFVQITNDGKTLDIDTIENAIVNYVNMDDMVDLTKDLNGGNTGEKGLYNKIRDKEEKLLLIEEEKNKTVDAWEVVLNRLTETEEPNEDLQKEEENLCNDLELIEQQIEDYNKEIRELRGQLGKAQSYDGSYEGIDKQEQEYLGKGTKILQCEYDESFKKKLETSIGNGMKGARQGYRLRVPGHSMYMMIDAVDPQKMKYICYDPNEGLVELNTREGMLGQINSMVNKYCDSKSKKVEIIELKTNYSGKKLRPEWMKKAYKII
jgi:hypothetical protein